MSLAREENVDMEERLKRLRRRLIIKREEARELSEGFVVDISRKVPEASRDASPAGLGAISKAGKGLEDMTTEDVLQAIKHIAEEKLDPVAMRAKLREVISKRFSIEEKRLPVKLRKVAGVKDFVNMLNEGFKAEAEAYGGAKAIVEKAIGKVEKNS